MQGLLQVKAGLAPVRQFFEIQKTETFMCKDERWIDTKRAVPGVLCLAVLPHRLVRQGNMVQDLGAVRLEPQRCLQLRKRFVVLLQTVIACAQHVADAP